ncbi:hypothetical protein [Tissierella sp.]|uniref:glycosyltransferase n=1 Tax=Tissierella sp. TaxID=41274 RepID=UPI0028ABCA45|nr:hypothetical protein [Tissierella sp.]
MYELKAQNRYKQVSLKSHYRRYIEQRKYKNIKTKNSAIERILFMPTNGGGLGHLTRTLAVARRLKRNYPNVEIIFFTTSFALNLIIEEGFLAYYFPSLDLDPVNVDQKEIDMAIHDQIISIIIRHNIDTLVFDGVFPYAYLVSAIEKLNFLNTVWIQRGMYKSGKSQVVIEREKYFNLIIVPGEANLNNNLLEQQGKFRYCSPIIYSRKEELLSKEVILKMWNLDPNKKTVYIQLGEGLNNDVNSLIFKIIQNLKLKKNLQIVLGESIIAHKKYYLDPDIFIIRDYPNSIYFNAFDFAIITGSYNTFHETIYFGVPTIIFPTKETGTDDHFARAKIASKLQTGFVFSNFNESEFEKAVSQLLDSDINEKMKKNTKGLFENGAELAVQYIMQSI